MADKLDPFDVAALEKSLNDSATRVSTIWVSFLIFSLYLLITAATVEHRQLFLAEPVKLPVLNIDLPLWGFFFLAPILFVIFHAYVLIQVILLARTAAAYNEAVEENIKVAADNARVRQRLANTLFAQIFAGSPRERAGWLGWLLKKMAGITLAIAPILILLVFQFAFLPYHSHLATWTHRLLILAELAAVFWLWPLVLDSRRDFDWSKIRRRMKRTAGFPIRLLAGKIQRRHAWRLLRHGALPVVSCVLFVFVSLSVATFPGEPHVNLATGYAWSSVQCGRWFAEKFDRLDLPRVDVVDDEKLKKIEESTKAAGEEPYQGERTRILRDRDLNCGDFSQYADLRRVDLTGAHLKNAKLENAKLQGASLNGAQLQGASLVLAQLQGASLSEAQLQGAFLEFAQLQGASLLGAQLQGASLLGAQLQGASLVRAQLQGAELDRSAMTYTRVLDTYVWRAKNAACHESRVRGHKPEPIVAIIPPEPAVEAKPDEIVKFIARSVVDIPDAGAKERARAQMRAGLVIDPAKDDTDAIAKVWSDCEAAAAKISEADFDRRHAEFLRDLVCEATINRQAVAKGIIRNWISDARDRHDFSVQLARGLLGQDGKECAATKDLDESDKERLRKFAPASPPAQTPAPKQQ